MCFQRFQLGVLHEYREKKLLWYSKFKLKRPIVPNILLSIVSKKYKIKKKSHFVAAYVCGHLIPSTQI